MNEQELIITACKAYTRELYKLLEFHNSLRPRGRDLAPISRAIITEIHLIEDVYEEYSRQNIGLAIKATGKRISKSDTPVEAENKNIIIKSCAAYERLLLKQIQLQNDISRRGSDSPFLEELRNEYRAVADIAFKISDPDRYELYIKSASLKGISKPARKKRARKKKE